MDFRQKLLAAQAQLDKNDSVISQLIMQYGDCRIQPHSDHYGELVSSIVGQQLSAKAGAVIWNRILNLFGGKMPSPQQLVDIDTEKVRSCGVSYAKVRYMKDLAHSILDRRLDMEHIATMPNEQLIEQLTAVKGIGEWSAQMYMIFGLGRLDVLPTGDLGVRKAMMQQYNLDRLPDPTTCITIAADNRWHPYESVASWYLWKSLNNNPRK